MLTDDRDVILAAVDLEALWREVAGERARGGGWPCPNPAHAQTGATPPVSIDATKGLWKCWGCDEAGTAVDLLRLAHDLTVADAFAELRRRAGMTDRHRHRPASRPRVAPVAPVARPPADTAERLLDGFLAARGWRRDVADLAGLEVVLDARGCPRVRFPFRVDGTVEWWQDRAIAAKDDTKWMAPRKEVAAPVPYAVRDLALALGDADTAGGVVLVEGPADAVALTHAWPAGAVIALPGTTSAPVRRLPAMLAGWGVVTMFDADDAGDALRAKVTGPLVATGCSVAHLTPPAPDLDDWRRRAGDDDRWRDEVEAALDGIGWEVPA